MDGQLLREGESPHRCEPPKQAQTGAVWRCDCSRRWICVSPITESPRLISMQAHWRRRYWPWPRTDRSSADKRPYRAHSVGVTLDSTYQIQPVDAPPTEPATPATVTAASLPKVSAGPGIGVTTVEHHCAGCRCFDDGGLLDYDG
jgi:hypothetical protein